MPPSSPPLLATAPGWDTRSDYAALYPKNIVQELRLLAQVFENSALAVMITDAQPAILKVNRAFEELTGYGEREARGRNPSFLRGSETREREFYAGMWRTLREEGKWSGELVNERRDGSRYPLHLAVSAIRDDEGEVTHYIGQFYDITARKAAEERIERLAHFDGVTGLPNRALLADRAKMALAAAQRQQQQRVGLLFVDLDGFKHINDVHGHDAGDRLLVEMADRLTRSVRASDTVARQGGDEFVVLLSSINGRKDAARVADAIIKRLARPFVLNGVEVSVTGSVGIAVHPEDGVDFATLQRHADAAMYEAKGAGKNRYAYFARAISERAEARLSLEQDLHRALRQNELAVTWTPQACLASGQLAGIEAAPTWPVARHGLTSAETLLPAAEAAGLAAVLHEWLVAEVIGQRARWLAQGLAAVPASVTVPAAALSSPGFVTHLRRALADYRLPRGTLELVIPETALLGGGDAPLAALRELSALGVRFSLTGLGGGHSGLPFLSRLPLSRLRIERATVAALDTEAGLALAVAQVALARMLGLISFAEGVETPLQHRVLRDMGCAEASGPLLALPPTLPSITAWPQPAPLAA